MSLDAQVYKKILGVLLLIPVARFFLYPNTADKDLKATHIGISLLVGGTIGFLSGLIGIGGGILLSPFLLLANWTNQKQTAAISAVFIFVNSVAGLAGQISKGYRADLQIVNFIAIAFVGGLIGAWMGSLRLNQQVLKTTLAIVLLLASIKLLVT